jgi:transcription elongation factor GreA
MKITKEKYTSLQIELDDLINKKRKENLKDLHYALTFGDLRENSAYDYAKEEQARTENRILKIEDILNNCDII